MTPKVSIIVPTYNGSRFILETIASVIAQSFDDFEVVIIDDGSTDGVGGLVKGMDSRIRLHRQENRGIAGARNTGLGLASGRYITFVDHDDYWHPEKLSAQLALLEARPEVGVCYGAFEPWPGESPESRLRHSLDSTALDFELSGSIYHALVKTNYVLLGTAMFRREIMERVGEFNVALPPADDWDYAVRASQITEFAKLRDVVTLYRIHPGMTSRKPFAKDHETDFRESIYHRYGLSSKDGRATSASAYRACNYRSCVAHGHANYKAGSFDIASRSFWRAIGFRPFAPEAYAHLIQANLRWFRQRVFG